MRGLMSPIPTWLVALSLLALAARAAETNLFIGPPSAPTGAAALFDDPLIARGQGFTVKRSELEQSFVGFKVRMALRREPVPDLQRRVLEAQLLDGLIVTRILAGRATPEDQARARERLEKLIEEFKKANGGSDDALRLQLKARGLTYDEFYAGSLREEVSKVVTERELKPRVSITDAQVRDFYDNGIDGLARAMQAELQRVARNPDTPPERLAAMKRAIDGLRSNVLARLQLPEKVRVSHILLATRDRQTDQELPESQKRVKHQLAEQLLGRARAGEDFARLVQQYSEDLNLKVTQGEYTFTREDPFAPEFKAAAFSLSTNRPLSDIVITYFGYHVIKLLERVPARKIEFEVVAADIRSALADQELQRLLPEYYDQARKQAGVEIPDARYRVFDAQAVETPRPPS